MNVTFFMEQHIGHRTYYENLRRFVDCSDAINPNWVEISYEDSGGWWNRLPFLPAAVRGTMNGRAQVKRGLNRYPDSVNVFNTQVPAAVGGRVAQRRPYILSTDITPAQYDRMGAEYNHQPDRLPWLAAYKQRVNRNLFRGAARLLPWSNWACTSLLEDYGVDPHKIEVIPPGVDLDFWQPAACPRSDSGPLRILFVGGDFQRKGGNLLLRAFRALPPGSAELTLVTRSEVPAHPGVRVYRDLRPNTAELLALYHASDVFVLPTRAEAFGIAAVEAAAAGLPVIATAVGGLTDIVVDRKTGFLIATDDVDTLIYRLQLLAESPELREKLGRRARMRAEQCFDARQNAARILDIVIDIAKGWSKNLS